MVGILMHLGILWKEKERFKYICKCSRVIQWFREIQWFNKDWIDGYRKNFSWYKPNGLTKSKIDRMVVWIIRNLVKK